MSRKKRKTHKVNHGYDSHHILFYRKEWSKGCKLLLRRSFVYQIPIGVHQQLHATVSQVPPLDENEARLLWQRFKELDARLDIFEALEWLMANSPNADFGAAIKAQYDFLRDTIG